VSRMLQAPLQPPRSGNEAVTLADEIAELRAQRRDDIIADAMQGKGEFWCGPTLEYSHDIAEFVGRVMAMPTLAPETRWEVLRSAVKGFAREFAETRVSE
jgi:phosphoenolpyruvate carboxylase